MGDKVRETPLYHALKEVGMNFTDLAIKMKVPYHKLMYAVRASKYSIDEINAIIHYTGKNFEDLFPSPFRLKPQLIELNLSTAVNKARAPKAKKKREAVTLPSPPSPDPTSPIVPVEDQKNSTSPTPAAGFVVEDIYDGGLPPV